MAKSSNTSEIVYDFTCKNPGLSTYELAKRLSMSGGRIRHVLSQLKRIGLVEFKFERHNPARIRKLTFPISAFKLLPKSLIKDLKKLKLNTRT